MADFTAADMRDSRFTNVELNDARFHHVDFTGTQFHNVDMSGVGFKDADFVGVRIEGYVEDFVINGVDEAPLVDAELNRRHPERAKLRPSDPAGFREAWDVIEGLWQATVERARRLPPERLHEQVDGEWSFIQTLRHLVFATDAWVVRNALADPAPYDPLDLPHSGMGPVEGVPEDRDARPSLQEVLVLRADRMATVRGLVDGLTDASIAEMTTPVQAPGYPEARSYPVRECLQIVIKEEWAHRQYAERDLAVLEAR